MKLLSFSILLGSLLITFNYVWINRIGIINQTDTHSVLLNKWTGKHCVFFIAESVRDDQKERDIWKTCEIDENGKVTFP